MEDTLSTWAAAHPQNVRPLNNPLLSLTIRVMELIRPVREALSLLSLAPRRGEIVLIVSEEAWIVLEETLRLDSVAPNFEAPLRQNIAKALKAVRSVNLNETHDA